MMAEDGMAIVFIINRIKWNNKKTPKNILRLAEEVGYVSQKDKKRRKKES
jgi:hypothetical protein